MSKEDPSTFSTRDENPRKQRAIESIFENDVQTQI